MLVKDFSRMTVEKVWVSYKNKDVRIDDDDYLESCFADCVVDFIETNKDGDLILLLKMDLVREVD